MEITQETLKSLLEYDPETGIFIWKERPREHFKTKRSHTIWNVKNAGKEAGWLDEKGYVRIKINEHVYKAHRMVFLYIYGWMPKEVDHVNVHGLKSDNRLANLRAATSAQNRQNRGLRKDNQYGVKGISFHKKTGKWQAEIQSDGKRHFLGCYDSQDKAMAAYEKALSDHHGEFARSK